MSDLVRILLVLCLMAAMLFGALFLIRWVNARHELEVIERLNQKGYFQPCPTPAKDEESKGLPR